MDSKPKPENAIPLYISRSSMTTQGNQTGFWRFVRPKYQDKTAPCSTACPVGQDISRIEMFAAQGAYKSAWQTIMTENPLPSVCGRVCFHKCETRCNRKDFDESIAIHQLERFLGDKALRENYKLPQTRLPANGKRIAIIGSGPSGLSCAYFLSQLGYLCEIFEANKKPGGVLRWGIPQYRLPKDILSQEIKRIEDLGVTITCNTVIDHDFLQKAKTDFDGLFVGCGYGKSIQMKVPGEELTHDGLNFLFRVRNDEITPFTGKCAVIGGGNTAIDVSRSLIRLGAQPTIVYRRRVQDMPAFLHEIELARTEGVEILELLAPVNIDKKENQFALTAQKMKVEGTTSSGRARVVPDHETTETLEFDYIFSAIGADVKEPWQLPAQNPEKDQTIINLSHCTLNFIDFPIFYGGDIATPVKSVADALASGKQAALALDILFNQSIDDIIKCIDACCIGDNEPVSMEIYLKGERSQRKSTVVTIDDINLDYFENKARIVPRTILSAKSITGFEESEQTLSDDMAISEASRCFNCGMCNHCDNCLIFCPEMAITCDGIRSIDAKYCKGCGICVHECPRNAMTLEEEKI